MTVAITMGVFGLAMGLGAWLDHKAAPRRKAVLKAHYDAWKARQPQVAS